MPHVKGLTFCVTTAWTALAEQATSGCQSCNNYARNENPSKLKAALKLTNWLDSKIFNNRQNAKTFIENKGAKSSLQCFFVAGASGGFFSK